MLREFNAPCRAHRLLSGNDFSLRERLEDDGVVRPEHERANRQVQSHLTLLLLHLVNYFIANQLKQGLDQVGATVAHICNRLETGRDQVLVDSLHEPAMHMG